MGEPGRGRERLAGEGPAPGVPLFQAATANLNPWTEAKVDITNPDRGPLLIISGEKDNTVHALAASSYVACSSPQPRPDAEPLTIRRHAAILGGLMLRLLA